MIRFSTELAKRMSCTDEEKRALGPLIRRFIALAHTARKEGCQILTRESLESDTALFKVGLRLVAEGITGTALEEILASYLFVSEDSGWPFLQSCVIIDGLISIAKADDTQMIVRKLIAYYGADRALSALMELQEFEDGQS